MKKIIDARGETCPIPVVKARKALESGCDNLEIFVDNEIAVQNLEKLATLKGYSFAWVQSEPTVYRAEFMRDGAVREEDSTVCACNLQLDKAVVVSSQYMGSGDDELGAILMKGFLYALSQQAELPGVLLLYNGGVKLAIKGSTCEEELKDLERAGVQIKVCGTCLNHYGLQDKMSVGSVTNMYEIVEMQMKASMVIRP